MIDRQEDKIILFPPPPKSDSSAGIGLFAYPSPEESADRQSAGNQEEQAPMSTNESPYDAFNAINEARREAREHTDAVIAGLRNEAREDRREVLKAITDARLETKQDLTGIRAEMSDIRAEIKEVRTEAVTQGKILAALSERVNMLMWVFLAIIAVATLILGLAQYFIVPTGS